MKYRDAARELRSPACEVGSAHAAAKGRFSWQMPSIGHGVDRPRARLMEYLQQRDFGCRSSHALLPGCKTTCSYSFFIGVSGVAPCLSWKPGWQDDNLEIMYMSDDAGAPFDRAFQATGYEFQFQGVGNEEGRDTEEFCRKQIIESIQKGRPVLAFGPVGPPPTGPHHQLRRGRGRPHRLEFLPGLPRLQRGPRVRAVGPVRGILHLLDGRSEPGRPS